MLTILSYLLISLIVSSTNAFVRPPSGRLATSRYDSELPAADALALQQQAARLREEAQSLQQSVEDHRQQLLAKEQADIERWMQHLLVNATYGDTEVLNTVEYTTELLESGRFSEEQVLKIFDRLCQERFQSRSQCCPRMELLVDACGRLDCRDRAENRNKRWSGKVERDLRKRLFAKDWGIELAGKQEDVRW